ncbi:hypothetical protein M3J09_001975 [Ascochyta lentis]
MTLHLQSEAEIKVGRGIKTSTYLLFIYFKHFTIAYIYELRKSVTGTACVRPVTAFSSVSSNFHCRDLPQFRSVLSSIIRTSSFAYALVDIPTFQYPFTPGRLQQHQVNSSLGCKLWREM